MTLRALRTAARLVWRAHPAGTIAVVGGSVVLGSFPVVSAWLAKVVVDTLSGGGGAGVVVLLVGLLAGSLLLAQLAGSVLQYVSEQLSRRVEIVAQGELFASLNRFPGLADLERSGFHDRLQLAQQAGQQAPFQLVTVAAGMLQGITSVAGFVALLLAVNPWGAALAAIAAVPRVIAELRLARQSVALQRGMTPLVRRTLFYSRLQTEPRAAAELRLFGLGAHFHARMLGELRSMLRSERGLARRVLLVHTAMEAIAAIAVGAGIVVVAVAATTGRGTPGDVVAVLAALPATMLAVTALVQQFATGAEAAMFVGHHQDVVDAARRATATAEGLPCPPARTGLTLEDVWFRYDDDLPWVLRGVTVHLAHGSSLGVVGLNGAGKSTLVKLITGLYPPTKGRILWDGIDLREIDPVSLRQRMGVVLQDFMTYDLTVEENVGLGDLAHVHDRARIQMAARHAGADEMVQAFPRGYATMLSRTHGSADGDDGSGVMPSGGQWQRLALARMLMRADRDLFILDEPSASLDPESEQEVLRLIHRDCADSARILVSHRLGSIRMTDVVVVLAEGRVVEQGSHDDLMRAGGRYAQLFRAQAAGYRD